jgi:hypothetical protein
MIAHLCHKALQKIDAGLLAKRELNEIVQSMDGKVACLVRMPNRQAVKGVTRWFEIQPCGFQ